MHLAIFFFRKVPFIFVILLQNGIFRLATTRLTFTLLSLSSIFGSVGNPIKYILPQKVNTSIT